MNLELSTLVALLTQSYLRERVFYLGQGLGFPGDPETRTDICIPHEDFAQNFFVVGDTGSGKTAQLLRLFEFLAGGSAGHPGENVLVIDQKGSSEALKLARFFCLRRGIPFKFVDLNPELRNPVEMTARWRALHGFLYEFSNFGRLPDDAQRAEMLRLATLAVERAEV